MDRNMVQSAVAEFIGTFMLVLIGAGAVTVFSRDVNSPTAANIVMAALAHGLILIAIIYTYGHISGAHVNPAVTLGLLVGGRVDIVRSVIYWVAQFAGAIVAALVLRYIFPNATNLGQTAAPIDALQIIVLEALLTFFLVSTVFQAAVYGRAGGLAPVAIGFTLAGCILMCGGITGASLNPARTLGPGLVTGDLTNLPAYLIGMFGGGALAGLVQTLFFGPEKPAVATAK